MRGLFGSRDHRADNPVRSGVEHAHDLRRVVVLNTHQQHRRGGGECLRHRQGAGEIDHPVLQIHGHCVIPLMADNFRAVARRDRQPAVDDWRVFLNQLFEFITSH
ncbi:hypothetical protein D3C87_1700180 [compost metagenome]